MGGYYDKLFKGVGSELKTCFLSHNYRICDVIKLQHNLTANVGVHKYAKHSSMFVGDTHKLTNIL